MTNDGDRFDDMIDDAAREYNRAPETPRAEMWERIQAARSRGAAVPVSPLRTPVAPSGTTPAARPDIVPIHTHRRRPMWWAAGLAATLMLGVAIGRMSTPGDRGRPERSASTVDGPRTVAQLPGQSPESLATGPLGSGRATPNAVGGGSATPLAGATRSVRVAATPNGTAGAGAEAIATGYKSAVEQRAERRAAEVALPYRLAAAEHLAMTEALLVSFRADMKSGRRDSTVVTWATNLLGTTRMLIDSPASKDPQMKKLLEDLELVLAQIARLPATSADSSDVELIDKAVKERQVLTRLRAIGPRT